MSATPIKNLTVRLDPETREQLELIANREVRPMANQIVVFVRQGIERYLQDNNLKVQRSITNDADDDGSTITELRLVNAPRDF